MVSSTPSAERLLTAIHPACSHDLPNQILSLQSLINLLEMDEAARLDGTGREYLVRLKAVSDKTAALVDFVKQSVRLARHTPTLAAVDLGELFHELAVEARSVLSTSLKWDFHLVAAAVLTDRDLVYPSFGDLVRAIAESNTQEKRITITSKVRDRHIHVELSVTASGLDKMAAGLEKRCDVVLARERLAVAGIPMTVAKRSNEIRLAFEFPGA